jgi:hypothetical protein
MGPCDIVVVMQKRGRLGKASEAWGRSSRDPECLVHHSFTGVALPDGDDADDGRDARHRPLLRAYVRAPARRRLR